MCSLLTGVMLTLLVPAGAQPSAGDGVGGGGELGEVRVDAVRLAEGARDRADAPDVGAEAGRQRVEAGLERGWKLERHGPAAIGPRGPPPRTCRWKCGTSCPESGPWFTTSR